MGLKVSLAMEKVAVVDELQDELLQHMLTHVRATDEPDDQSLHSRFILLPYSAQRNVFMGLMQGGASKRVPSLCGTPPYPFLDRNNDYLNLSASGFTAGRVNMAMKTDIPSRRHFGKQYQDNEGRHFRLRTGIELKDENTLYVILPNMKHYRFPNVEDQLTLSPTNDFAKLTKLTDTYKVRVKSIKTTTGLNITAALIYTLL